MDTEVTQEMVDNLREILIIKQVQGKDGHTDYITVFDDGVEQNVIDRLQMYDMLKDEYTKEEMYEFLNHFARIIEVVLGTYTIKDFDRVFQLIYDDENTYGMELDTLSAWFTANPFKREDYVNDAIERLIDTDDPYNLVITKILQEAKLIETLEVFDLGYNFIKWYLGIDETEEEE